MRRALHACPVLVLARGTEGAIEALIPNRER
jgi:hypothetical protein